MPIHAIEVFDILMTVYVTKPLTLVSDIFMIIYAG